MSMGAFAGKTIIVTGSGKHKGLGQGILQAFADEGANCVVSDRTIDAEAEEVAGIIATIASPIVTTIGPGPSAVGNTDEITPAIGAEIVVIAAVEAIGGTEVIAAAVVVSPETTSVVGGLPPAVETSGVVSAVGER